MRLLNLEEFSKVNNIDILNIGQVDFYSNGLSYHLSRVNESDYDTVLEAIKLAGNKNIESINLRTGAMYIKGEVVPFNCMSTSEFIMLGCAISKVLNIEVALIRVSSVIDDRLLDIIVNYCKDTNIIMVEDFYDEFHYERVLVTGRELGVW